MTVTVPGLDLRQHTAALIAALTTTLGMDPLTTNPRAFTYDEVPGEYGNEGTLPNIYVALTVERLYVAPQRAGAPGRSGWRATTRSVGRNVAEVFWCELAVANALDNTRLTVGSRTSSRVRHETTPQPPERDDQRWSGLATWTYVI